MAIAFEIAVRRGSCYGFFHIAYLPDYQKHLEGEARGVTLKDVYALQNGAPMVHDTTSMPPAGN